MIVPSHIVAGNKVSASYFLHFRAEFTAHCSCTAAASTERTTGRNFQRAWNITLQNNTLLEMVKTYMYLKVRMIFDTPTSGSMNSAHEQQIAELEWRINVMVDPGFEGVEDDE